MTGLFRADGTRKAVLTARQRMLTTLILHSKTVEEASAIAAALAGQGYAVRVPEPVERPLGKEWQLVAYMERAEDCTVELILPGGVTQ